jgi:hypothetical protein
MHYVVVVAKTALDEANQYTAFIRKRSHDHIAADRWWNGLLDAIFSLEKLPGRCPKIPEQAKFKEPLYQLLYESHRIVFAFEPGHVHVLRVCHASRKPLTPASIRSI